MKRFLFHLPFVPYHDQKKEAERFAAMAKRGMNIPPECMPGYEDQRGWYLKPFQFVFGKDDKCEE